MNDNNLESNNNPLSNEKNITENIQDNTQQNPNNTEVNPKDNGISQNPGQNQYIINSSNEDIIPKINALLQQNKFNESYISFILESYNGDPNILNIFLSKGANVNTFIHSTNCQIEEKDQINLLMYSIITNKMDLFKLVIKYNPDILLEDKNKKNSLIYSIFFNDDNNPFIIRLQL